MAKNTNFCMYCGKEYELCSTCEKMRGKVFAYKQFFCSTECFKNNEKGGGIMRVQYQGKMYTVKKYDLKKSEYITSNDLKLKEEEIDVFILSNDEYKELKDFKTVAKQAKKEDEVE